MDIRRIVQSIRKGEEVIGVEEIVAVKVVDNVRDESFLGACVHGGRGHNNFGYRNKKQSRRVIGISLVVRYRPYFF